MHYLVSYDLLRPGQNYDGLINAIKQLGGKRVLLSAWAFYSTATAVQLRDHLRQFIDQNDRLLVTGINGWASWNVINPPAP